jgi:hypothetical protein
VNLLLPEFENCVNISLNRAELPEDLVANLTTSHPSIESIEPAAAIQRSDLQHSILLIVSAGSTCVSAMGQTNEGAPSGEGLVH